MRLSQVSSKALPALQGWEPHVLGAQRELAAIPSIVVILPSRELRDPQELISKVKQKKEEKCSPGYTAPAPLGLLVTIMGSSPSESQLSPGKAWYLKQGCGSLHPSAVLYFFPLPAHHARPLQNLTVTPCSLKCQPHSR